MKTIPQEPFVFFDCKDGSPPSFSDLYQCACRSEIMNEFECEFVPTERDKVIHELATRYHVLCESYDRTVCTGPIRNGSIMPASGHEMRMINKNARHVRKLVEDDALIKGVGRKELWRAIGNWKGD